MSYCFINNGVVKQIIVILNISVAYEMATPKAMTIKEAIKRWEEKSGQQAATATEVSLIFQWPPIEKMDNSLACLTNCE